MTGPTATGSTTATVATVTAVRFEHRRAGDGLGIGVAAPRLSWITETDAPGWRQVAHEIEVIDGRGVPATTPGRVGSDESVFVPWPAEPLESRQRRRVRVRVWGSDGAASAWSEPAEGAGPAGEAVTIEGATT